MHNSYLKRSLLRIIFASQLGQPLRGLPSGRAAARSWARCVRNPVRPPQFRDARDVRHGRLARLRHGTRAPHSLAGRAVAALGPHSPPLPPSLPRRTNALYRAPPVPRAHTAAQSRSSSAISSGSSPASRASARSSGEGCQSSGSGALRGLPGGQTIALRTEREPPAGAGALARLMIAHQSSVSASSRPPTGSVGPFAWFSHRGLYLGCTENRQTPQVSHLSTGFNSGG